MEITRGARPRPSLLVLADSIQKDDLQVGGWTNPSKKYARQNGNLPQNRGEQTYKIFELPPASDFHLWWDFCGRKIRPEGWSSQRVQVQHIHTEDGKRGERLCIIGTHIRNDVHMSGGKKLNSTIFSWYYTTAPMNFLNAKKEGSAQMMFLFKLVFTSFLCRDCPQSICGMIIQKSSERNQTVPNNICIPSICLLDLLVWCLEKDIPPNGVFFMMIYMLWNPNQWKITFNLKVRKLEHTILWIIFSGARLWMTASKTFSTRKKSWEQKTPLHLDLHVVFSESKTYFPKC